MEKHTIITIGRQYGSGGKEIGLKLAERLGIKCYDNELLSIAAKESGFCEEVFKVHDEKPTNSFLYSLVMDTYHPYGSAGVVDVPLSQKVFLAQFDTIKKIAKQESCVFVGRCADYALQDDFNITSIFITSDLESKTKRICERLDVTPAKAKELIIKTDKKRASYYNYYTNKKWGNTNSYDLCIDSSILGIDNTVELILYYLKLSDNIEV